MRHVFLDCEWTLDQNIFLLSYAFRNGDSGSVHGRDLNHHYIRKLLRPVRFIYVYGPDIAYMEKNFPIDFRDRFYCINMLKLVKLVIPGLPSYKLAEIEKIFRIHRSTRKYKTSVFTIWKHWHDHKKREHVIRYNLEDARNLRELYYILSERYGLNRRMIMECRLI
jgi:hypothetical protein